MPEDTGENSLKKQNKLFKKIFGANEDNLSAEQKILLLVAKANEKGIIENSSRNMIENIFDFDDLTASELMTHRTDITAIEKTDSIDNAAKVFIKSGHSRIPVYNGDIDNIIGFLYAKDLLKYVGIKIDSSITIESITREAIFVPRSKNCSVLFAELTSDKMQMAVVVDEYGGTEGIITMEDLIESIVGNIQDEYDNEEEELKKISDTIYTVDGGASIDDVSHLINVNLQIDDCETIAGLMLEHLVDVPKDSDRPSVIIDKVKFTAVKIEDRRIARIMIEKI